MICLCSIRSPLRDSEKEIKNNTYREEYKGVSFFLKRQDFQQTLLSIKPFQASDICFFKGSFLSFSVLRVRIHGHTRTGITVNIC